MDCLEFLDRKSIKVNEFNKKFINHVENNNFNIIMNSEEVDICKSYALYLLFWITREENENKNIYIISHNYHQCLLIKKELIELSKRIYLPIEVDSDKYTQFENGIKIRYFKLHKNIVIDEPSAFTICIDIAETENYVFMNFYKQLLPFLTTTKNSKLIINSQPNGFNLFYKLFTDGENNKNILKSLRIYYWEDGKKDGNWVKEKMENIGESLFHRRYNLIFTHVKGERKLID